MLSGIARQECKDSVSLFCVCLCVCVCECADEHGRGSCLNLLFHLHLCINFFNHGVTDGLKK